LVGEPADPFRPAPIASNAAARACRPESSSGNRGTRFRGDQLVNTAHLDRDTTTGDARTVELHFSHDGDAIPLTVTITASSPWAVIRDPVIDEFLKTFAGRVEASRSDRRKSKRRLRR
jgi:hypothetical protein